MVILTFKTLLVDVLLLSDFSCYSTCANMRVAVMHSLPVTTHVISSMLHLKTWNQFWIGKSSCVHTLL